MRQLLILFCALSHALCAQQLTGTVIDQTTNQPLAFATVYLSQTLIGTTSDQNGNFKLKGIEPGKYNLIATYVGYRALPLEMVIEEGATYEVTLYMVTDPIRLREVEIIASDENRDYYLETFRKHFIGYTDEAKKCKIVNEDDIFFQRNGDYLNAYSDRPIEVVNKKLGYRLFYELYDFQYNFKSQNIRLYGVPRFEELKNDPRKSWEIARNRSYTGSLLHFFNAISEEGTSQSAFTIKSLSRVPNPERLPDSVILEAIKLFDGKSEYLDTIRYLKKNYQMPRYVDKEGKILSVKSILKKEGKRHILKGGAYLINHTTELLEPQSKYYLGSKDDYSSSKLFILDKKLEIYPNGYVEDASKIYIEGYWGWSEKIGNLLPLSYKPDNH